MSAESQKFNPESGVGEREPHSEAAPTERVPDTVPVQSGERLKRVHEEDESEPSTIPYSEIPPTLRSAGNPAIDDEPKTIRDVAGTQEKEEEPPQTRRMEAYEISGESGAKTLRPAELEDELARVRKEIDKQEKELEK